MLFSYAFLASMAAGTALSLDSFVQPQSKAFRKRQEFSPTTLTCGPGDTCAESCGTGYILCSDPTTFLCYNPGVGQSCCDGGSSSSWACPSGSFCLIDDFCCPDGEDPNTCAAANSVTLPATFVASTATPAAGTSTTSSSYVAASTTSTITASVETLTVATPTSTSSADAFTQPTASTTSPSVSTFTGSATTNVAMGNIGLLHGILVLLGYLL